MKYKVGDKFLEEIEIEEIDENGIYSYKITGRSFWRSEGQLNRLRRPDDMTAEEAWKLAGKITEMSCGELIEIFPECEGMYVMRNFPPQEARTRIKAWEVEKETEVGDVVMAEDSAKAIVLDIQGDTFNVLVENGCVEEWYKNKVTKTGRHIDIKSILEQIGGGENEQRKII